MINIIPLSNEGRDCYEDILASVAQVYSANYPFMYCHSWAFDYIKGDGGTLLGSQIKCEWGNLEEYLEKYSGVKVVEMLLSHPTEALAVLKDYILNGKAVAFTIGLQYCEWHNFSGSHLTHTIVGCDINEKEILCIDCKPVKSGINLSIDSFLKGYAGKLLIFEQRDTDVQGIEIFELIAGHMKELKKSEAYQDAFTALRAFADSMEKVDINEECINCSDFDFWSSPIFNNINNLCVGRRQYARYLQHVDSIKGTDRFNDASSALLKCSDNFNMARSLLMKAKITGSSQPWINKASNLFRVTAGLEEEILKNIESIIR
ncbi:MAG: hypothetical protein N3I35_04915 [Clostridia bacterium]|nr:hypothetical protein [Clostridia bacterium]